MNSDEIRHGLRSIRTRSSTIDAVAGEGVSMIDLLLPILQDRNEGVRCPSNGASRSGSMSPARTRTAFRWCN